MKEIFFNAKNGDFSCKLNEYFLHSNYNPQKEAERFVSTIESDFEPKYIFLTGACLDHTVKFFNTKFPNAKICAIQYSKSFEKYSSNWAKCFYIDFAKSLKDELFNFVEEEDLNLCMFLSWKPSENAYPKEYAYAWNEIKDFVKMSRDVLGTRIFFNKRWVKNSLQFCLKTQNLLSIENIRTNLPIVLAASGPRLKYFYNILKENRQKFFLLAVSSAALPLIHAGIYPDAVISTDGGFWAKEHLQIIEKTSSRKNIPVFATAEGAFYSQLLENSSIIPLAYGDAPEKILYDICKIKTAPALRNGTVSGTAATLALNLSSSNIFCIGLDLSSSKGFQHSQPNQQEIRNGVNNFRLSPLENRCAASTFHSASLELYKNWFIAQSEKLKNRVFRVFPTEMPYNFKLGSICNLNENEFEQALNRNFSNLGEPKTIQFEKQKLPSQTERKNLLINYFNKLIEETSQIFNNKETLDKVPENIEIWYKSFVLTEFANAKHNKNPMTQEMYSKIIENIEDLILIAEKYEPE